MPTWLIVLYCLHIGAGLYWLGSSFLVALAKGKGAEAQYRPQMIAAAVTFALGLALWGKLHPSGIGKMETVLGLGALLAIAAAGLQGAWVGGSIRRLRKGLLTEDQARPRIVRGERYAAILLALALLAMVGSYHV